VTNESPSEQWKLNPTHVILTLVGIAGLVLFILACRPSWSPDGRKILYSYTDEGAKKSAVAVFDRKTRTSRVLFEWWDETGSGENTPGAQWTKDGERVIVSIYEENGIQLLAIPVNAQKAYQAYTLKKMDEAAFLPFPEVGNKLFLMSGDVQVRVDLTTGAIFRKELKEELDCVLYDAGNKVFYINRVEEKAAEDTKDKDAQKVQGETPGVFEIGELDQNDLSLRPFLTLKLEELKAKGIGTLTGLVDVHPKSLRIAASEDPLEGKPARVLVIGKGGIEQVLEVGIKEKPYELGNPQWSRDGKTIYVSALIHDTTRKTAEFAVLEVPLDGKATRIDRMEERPKSDFGDDYLLQAQIALSPDDQMIAVTNGHLEKVRPERRGLFLLDLSRPERPVKFYVAPALPVAGKTE
jgi:dipeptidyl aminopeptidase/acylaminoacyl peptidase